LHTKYVGHGATVRERKKEGENGHSSKTKEAGRPKDVSSITAPRNKGSVVPRGKKLKKRKKFAHLHRGTVSKS